MGLPSRRRGRIDFYGGCNLQGTGHSEIPHKSLLTWTASLDLPFYGTWDTIGKGEEPPPKIFVAPT